MSIENAIIQLADALHKVASGLHAVAVAQSGAHHNTVVTTDRPMPDQPEPKKPKAEKPKAEKKEEAPTTEQTTATQDKLVYSSFIQKPALDLVKEQGREALTEVLKKFGVTSAKEVPEARWQELRQAIDTARGANTAEIA